MGSTFFSEPRALLLKISLPTEGITKTVLIGLNATLADVREKLLSKLAKVQIPRDINNWAFLLTKNIEQMWLDDKVTLKAYNVKDGDMLEFKRKVKLLSKLSSANLGPWVKAAPKTTAIYEHQMDRPVSPDPRPSSPTAPQRMKTSTDMLFDALFEEKQKATQTTSSGADPPRPVTSSLASTSSPFNKRRNSVSRRKSNTLASLLTKSSTKSSTPKQNPSLTPKSNNGSSLAISKPQKQKKTSSGENPFSKLIRNSPPAMSPSSASPPASPSPSLKAAAPKNKKAEITEEEMMAWLDMEEKESKTTKQSDAQETSLRSSSHSIRPALELQQEPPQELQQDLQQEYQLQPELPVPETYPQPVPDDVAPVEIHVIDTSSPSNDENDFHLQIQKLEREFADQVKSSPQALSHTSEDGYVRQLIFKIEESEGAAPPQNLEFKEKKAKRRSRTASDARLSIMIQRTTEMEQQFSTYIAALTESLDQNEKTLDTVQALLFQMIKRIDENQLDLKGARRYAKQALDVISADAKKNGHDS